MQNLAALRKFIVHRLSFIVFLFILYAIPYTLYASPALAQSAPDPQPCQDPIWKPEVVTDNWLVNEEKEPPQNLHREVTRIGYRGQSVPVNDTRDFIVDFSKLSAIFGPTNSNYLEGKFQNDQHRNVDLINLVGQSSEEFNKYHGPSQKTAPQVMLDQLKVAYVKYVYEHPRLNESGNTFSDINGQNPKRIYDLVRTFGGSLPEPPSQGDDGRSWDQTWGKYWDKIPTAYSEFYEAKIRFRNQHEAAEIARVKNGQKCPLWHQRIITFVMPEIFRTTATSGQLNQIIVPKAAQSEHSNDLILNVSQSQSGQHKNFLGKIIDKCINILAKTPFSQPLKKVFKVGLNLLDPVKTVFAEEPDNCIKVLAPGKEGQDPYCALPRDQLQSAENCGNQNDTFKVDTNNPNVICTFRIYWEHPQGSLTIGSVGPGSWDWCRPIDPPPLMECGLDVAIWPVFQIPWIAEIWNNTLYSDTKENEPGIGSKDWQEEGRPGVYSFFTPNIVLNFNDPDYLYRKCEEADFDVADSHCQDFLNLVLVDERFDTECVQNFLLNPRNLIRCARTLDPEKKLPGETDRSSDLNGEDVKRRFIGGTDCSKEYVRDNALKPIALQQALGITNQCNLTAVHLPNTGTGPPPFGPPGPLNYYILYQYTSIRPFNKDAIIAQANSSWPNNNTDQWDYVVSQSISRRVSPAFTIAIWWEEGGFGGAGANSEFGCFPGGNTSQTVPFQQSLECFLNFTANEHPFDSSRPYGSFREWVSYFCGPSAVPLCANNPNFIDRLESIYNSVAPGAIIYVGNP